MRLTALLSLMLPVGILPPAASAQQIGDDIVAVADAPLQENNATTGSIKKGAILTVKDVKGDLFWVNHPTYRPPVKGWIHRKNMIPLSRVLDFLNNELKRNPTSSNYFERGRIWYGKGKLDAAIGDFNEAIRLGPTPAAYTNRGTAWADKQDYEKALADYNAAIRLDSKLPLPHYNRASVWDAKGDYGKAIADYDEAIRLDPKFAVAYNNCAWLQATCPDTRLRNGQRAVEKATKACELTGWKDASLLDTLAVAYAALENFNAAVQWQTKARDLAPENQKADYQSRVDLYKAHKPYREVPRR